MRELAGQTVVVIGGSSGAGRETARRARGEGADVILTAREPAELEQPGLALGAVGTAAFDAADPVALAQFFDSLSRPVEHVVVGAGDAPPARVAGVSVGKVTGSFVFIGPRIPIAELALKLAPIRINLIAPERMAGVAALAVHLLINTAITGATVIVHGGRPLAA